MDRTKIAIPCVGNADLEAQVSPHFGRCDSYAIVTLEEGKIDQQSRYRTEDTRTALAP